MSKQAAETLVEAGIRPSAQRVAVAEFVLKTADHPSADEVFARVRERFPVISRATVYNTLRAFVERGLLRSYELGGGRVVFDSNVEDHHHFIDEETGRIYDVAWDALRVLDVDRLTEFDVKDYQVVMRGNRRGKG